MSFFTSDVEAWFERAKAQDLELRTAELGDESGRVRVFVAYDPEGYFLEWDTFLDVEGNERLVGLLQEAFGTGFSLSVIVGRGVIGSNLPPAVYNAGTTPGDWPFPYLRT